MCNACGGVPKKNWMRGCCRAHGWGEVPSLAMKKDEIGQHCLKTGLVQLPSHTMDAPIHPSSLTCLWLASHATLDKLCVPVNLQLMLCWNPNSGRVTHTKHAQHSQHSEQQQPRLSLTGAGPWTSAAMPNHLWLPTRTVCLLCRGTRALTQHEALDTAYRDAMR